MTEGMLGAPSRIAVGEEEIAIDVSLVAYII
jgi:hypothetical protein